MRRFLFTLAVLAALVLPLADHAAGGGREKPVKASAKASKIGVDGKQTVTLTIDIEKDYYIYANPVDLRQNGIPLPDLDEEQLTVTIKAKEGVQAKVRYPVGQMKSHNGGKFGYRLYEKSVVIEAELRRAPGDTSPLDISIDFRPWKVGLCFPPGTIRLTVK